MNRPAVLAIVLAGGSGGRLGTLTDKRAKPALPVAGSYRLIDIPLSNLHHSGFSDVWMVQQYQPNSLNDHLANGRPWDLDRTHGGLRVLPPFEGRKGEGFADGNADSLYRQAAFIREFDPDLVLLLSADHLYQLDFRDVVQTHLEAKAAATIVTTRFDGDASNHGVVEVSDGAVTGFEYKPEQPKTDLVATEVFLFDAAHLLDTLELLEKEEGGLDDYGDQLLPHLVEHSTVVEHRLEGYWLDLGTPENYHRAHMELLDGDGLAFDDQAWPILTSSSQRLPAFVGKGAVVADSLLAPGSRVFGDVTHSVIGPGTVVEAGAVVVDSILLNGVTVRSGARIARSIVDSGATLDTGAQVGDDDAVTVVDRNGDWS